MALDRLRPSRSAVLEDGFPLRRSAGDTLYQHSIGENAATTEKFFSCLTDWLGMKRVIDRKRF